MLYFASDIHGEYALFQKLLEKIKFSPSDRMIICGDIVDKGPEPIRLAQFIFQQPNIQCIVGNHEFAFLKCYEAVMQKISDNFDRVLHILQDYFQADGYLLDWDTVDNFERLPMFIETDEYICVHAGIPVDENGYCIPLKEAEPERLVYDRNFKEANILPKNEKCILFGHTPTNYISGQNKILKYPRITNPKSIKDFHKIHLDMGTMISGVVGCICKETLEEFYVTKS